MKIHLVFGTLTILLLILVLSERRKPAFGYESVVAMAGEMAREGYLSAVPALPAALRELTYDEVRDIRWKNERTLWRREGLPFQARFFHPGGLHDRPVEIYEINGREVERLRYSPDFFDFGRSRVPWPMPENLGYAGFRIHHPINRPDQLDEVFVFLGASYFRAVAKDLHYGLSARGLAIDTGLSGRKEEFPVFTKFWLRRPDAFANNMVIYALLESGTVTGAYEFQVWPGPETHMIVTATLFFRRQPERLGYAPLTSMFWFGENTGDNFGDFRPEVHDSDGLLMQRGNGEWVWHPLAWSQQLQINAFPDTAPKGYGLFQRDRDFSHYQDLEAKYHQRPSLWVEPMEGFGEGQLLLIQLPTKDEYLDNVVAFWNPTEPPPLLEPVRLRYRLRWLGEAADLPPLGRAISTRVDDKDKEYYRHFILEFAGVPKRDGALPAADLSSPTGAAISDLKVEWNDFNSTWRVSFYGSSPENFKPHEFLCRLVVDGSPVTETWSYTWTP